MLESIKNFVCSILGICRHDCEFVSTWNYYDTSYGIRMASTRVTWVCNKCKDVKVQYHYGAGFIPESYFEQNTTSVNSKEN